VSEDEAVKAQLDFFIRRTGAMTGTESVAPIRPEELLASAHGRDWRETLNRRIGRGLGEPVIYQFRVLASIDEKANQLHRERVQESAQQRLNSLGPTPNYHVLLTGASGFIGRYWLLRAAKDERVARVTAVLRPGNTHTSGVKRGQQLLAGMNVPRELQGKFDFIDGDIEQDDLGLVSTRVDELSKTLTHVVHSAANVDFDSTFSSAYAGNVLGNRHVMDLALRLMRAPDSRFVSLINLSSAFICGHTQGTLIAEGSLRFARGYYNNFYELTKALAALDTERYFREHDLPVVQLLPTIVVGEASTGNSVGDYKAIHALIRSLGKVSQQLHAARMRPERWTKARSLLVSRLGYFIPGRATAEVNFVSVDRVAQGVSQALGRPQAIGQRIHLASVRGVALSRIIDIFNEELHALIYLVNPRLFKSVLAPVVRRLVSAGRGGLRSVLLRSIDHKETYLGYWEFGQPRFELGKDCTLLGLDTHRPNAEQVLRLLCRHSLYVLNLGKVRRLPEVVRRQEVWETALRRIETRMGLKPADISADRFRAALDREVRRSDFRLKHCGPDTRGETLSSDNRCLS
jgi:nucleoside-diphosphate-sugar epimerase